jgi:hypothetical protein
MQKLPVYLYTNSYSITLDLDNSRGVNNVMYQRNIIFQKGLKNKVQIQFKNSDQKPVSISSGTFFFRMFDNNNVMPFQPRQLEVIDDGVTTSTRGLALLTLSEGDTADITPKKYTFSITALDTDGSYVPTYANTYYGVNGTAEIREDVEPFLTESFSTDAFNWDRDTPIDRQGVPQMNWWTFSSGTIEVNPALNTNVGLHTFAFYLTNFKGHIDVYGTLENTPSGQGNGNESYALLESVPYSKNFTGVDYLNISGNYTNFKVKYVPDADGSGANWYGASIPGNPVPGQPYWPNGKIDKILFRS